MTPPSTPQTPKTKTEGLLGGAVQNGVPRGAPRRDFSRPSAEMILLRALSEYSCAHATGRLFCETVVRVGPAKGEFSIMNREKRGWGEYAYTYDSLWAVARAWRIVFVSFGRDECSAFVRVVPC